MVGSSPEYSKLSEEMMREFADRVDWVEFLQKQPISNELIRECSEHIDWKAIANECWQAENNHDPIPYSEEFMSEFGEKLSGYYSELEEEFRQQCEFEDDYEYDDYELS